jgi:hypothetical protein
MDISAPRVANKMATRGIWRNLLKFLMEFDCRDRFVIIEYYRDLPCTF